MASISLMKGYLVFQDDQPAILPNSEMWGNNFFRTFEKAKQYAKNWLGMYDTIPDDWQGERFEWGYGCTIEIRFQDGIDV